MSAADDYEVAYPAELRDGESKLLQARGAANAEPARARSVALSGGGIRSATFGLGVFQALARLQLLRHVDYVSTVSGGGYFGSFFGRLFTRRDIASAEQAEDVLVQRRSPEIVAALRENGRYLSPHGAGDLLLDGAVLFRNWVSLLVVISTSALAAYLAADTCKRALHYWLGDRYDSLQFSLNEWLPLGLKALWWSVWTALPMLLAVLIVIPLGLAYWLSAGSAIALFVLAPVLVLLEMYCDLLWGHELVQLSLDAIPFAAALFWFAAYSAARRAHAKSETPAVTREMMLRNLLSRWLKGWLFGSLALFGFALVDTLGQTVYLAIASARFESWSAWLGGLASSLALAAASARRLTMNFTSRANGKHASLPVSVIAGAIALLVGLLLLVSISTASHALAYQGKRPPSAAIWLDLGEEQREVLLSRAADKSGLKLEVTMVHPTTSAEAPEADIYAGAELLAALAAFGCALLLSFVFGRSWRFLTRSSYHPLYRARLTRAYLGASNPQRLNAAHSMTEVVAGDDIELYEYYGGMEADPGTNPYMKGAPLHLINVTVNETVNGRSAVQQQDRKGTGLALGPCGLSLGVRHHAVFGWSRCDGDGQLATVKAQTFPGKPAYRVFEGADQMFAPEGLTLGKWIAISGAAFSTGLGSRTSIGLSLLAGLANVRLGYWWNPGLKKLGRGFQDWFPVQAFLLKELLARFPGTAQSRWYLSDGGHFENMASYELIRRRTRTIILVDAEGDSDYTFEGLANLVRKARVDFGAEIEFLDEAALTGRVHSAVRGCFGTLEQLRRGAWNKMPGNAGASEHPVLETALETSLSLAHAALASVRYQGEEELGWLLYIKPTLTGQEPADLTQYHANHPSFPHESTADQFFDEAQWESYRKLGEHIATLLFEKVEPERSDADAQRWLPSEMLLGPPPVKLQATLQESVPSG